MFDKKTPIIERFWWARGFAAALALLALLTTYIDTSHYKLLLAFNIVIVSWNKLASMVGQAIGYLPFIPEIEAALVNTIILAFTLGLPALVHLVATAPVYVICKPTIRLFVYSFLIFMVGLALWTFFKLTSSAPSQIASKPEKCVNKVKMSGIVQSRFLKFCMIASKLAQTSVFSRSFISALGSNQPSSHLNRITASLSSLPTINL